MNYTPIIITGNWKTGTTLLQYLLMRDKEIKSIFPTRGTNDYEGLWWWKRVGVYDKGVIGLQNHVVPKDRITTVDYRYMRLWMNSNVGDYKYILLKTPQLILNLHIVNALFPNNKILATSRELIPTVYSYLRQNANCKRNSRKGMKPPGWQRYGRKSTIAFAVYAWYYAEDIIRKENLFRVKYSDICDNTEETLNSIADYIGKDLNIDYENINNLNNAYKTGTILHTRNRETSLYGKLQLDTPDKIEFPPMTKAQLEEVEEMSKKCEKEFGFSEEDIYGNE